MRKRRYHVSRQALGLDFYRWHTIGLPEPVSVSTATPVATATLVAPVTPAAAALPPATPDAAALAAAEFELESERKLELCRKALRTCLILLLVILFRKWIVLFLSEAPFAWPSLNGGF